MVHVSFRYTITNTHYRQPEAHLEDFDKQSEMAPHVQDDFDIPEEDLKELDPRDQQENQVHIHVSCSILCCCSIVQSTLLAKLLLVQDR